MPPLWSTGRLRLVANLGGSIQATFDGNEGMAKLFEALLAEECLEEIKNWVAGHNSRFSKRYTTTDFQNGTK